MIDNLEWFGLGYVHWTGLRELAVKYVLVVRMIWISERPLRRRLELLDQITEPIQGIFFAYWWHRLRHLRKDIRNFHQQLAELTED